VDTGDGSNAPKQLEPLKADLRRCCEKPPGRSYQAMKNPANIAWVSAQTLAVANSFRLARNLDQSSRGVWVPTVKCGFLSEGRVGLAFAQRLNMS